MHIFNTGELLEFTHIAFGQCPGLSSRPPCSKWCSWCLGSILLYGTMPLVMISHSNTPNDHCGKQYHIMQLLNTNWLCLFSTGRHKKCINWDNLRLILISIVKMCWKRTVNNQSIHKILLPKYQSREWIMHNRWSLPSNLATHIQSHKLLNYTLKQCIIQICIYNSINSICNHILWKSRNKFRSLHVSVRM